MERKRALFPELEKHAMSLAVYQWGIRLFTLLALVAWASVFITVDPDAAGLTGRFLFFGSFFASILGMLTLFVTWVYVKGLGEEGAAHHLGAAFRQAFLLAGFVLGNALFQFFGFLTWWDSLLLLAFVLLVELSLRSLMKPRKEVQEKW